MYVYTDICRCIYRQNMYSLVLMLGIVLFNVVACVHPFVYILS